MISLPTPTFSCAYDAANARLCRTHLNRTLLSDLGRCVEAARRPLPEQADKLHEKLAGLSEEDRLPPGLFLWQQTLLAAIREPNVAAARRALEALITVADEPAPPPGVIRRRSIEPRTPMTAALEEISLQELFVDGTPTRDDLVVHEIRFEPADGTGFDDWFAAAEALADQASTEVMAEVRELVSEIQFYDGPGPSLSSTRTFGTVFMALPDSSYDPVHYVLEHLTHEASHHLLFGLMAVDPMLLNADGERYYSPVRADPRPLYGIYHQAFVISRLVHLWNQLDDGRRPWAVERREYDLGRFRGADAVLRDHARLTEAGAELIASCRDLVRAATR